jgi:ATP phosphoribosyltransferase regulatory subunit HisZ
MRVIGTDKNGDEIAEVSVTELDAMFKEIRAKAIDEFANWLYENHKTDLTEYIKWYEEEIAEQLKAGGIIG